MPIKARPQLPQRRPINKRKIRTQIKRRKKSNTVLAFNENPRELNGKTNAPKRRGNNRKQKMVPSSLPIGFKKARANPAKYAPKINMRCLSKNSQKTRFPYCCSRGFASSVKRCSRMSTTLTGMVPFKLSSIFERILRAISWACISLTTSGETITRNSLPACNT